MLDDIFRGIQRDIGADVSHYLYTSYGNHTTVDFTEIDQWVVEAFHTTKKPAAVTHELWDEMLETICVGIDIGINMTWHMPTFYDQELDADEIMLSMMTVMRNVFARIARTIGPRILQEVVEADRAVRCIQHEWRDAISNPARPVCRARLTREFEDLNT